MEDHNTTLPLPQLPRRPRGFAAYAGKRSPGSGAKGGKKEREKERTKLRERHRRAITSRMLSGLRQHGNFPLPARADMNDVLAALAREAGWIVDADGTTYRKITTTVVAVEAGSINPPDATAAIQHMVDSFPGESSLSLTSFINNSSETSLSCHHHSVLSVNEEVLSPSLLESVVAMNGVVKDDEYVNTTGHINSTDCFETDEMLQEVLTSEKGNDYSGSPYIPVYVTLPTGVINNFCQLVEPESLRQELWCLKSMHVDGVIVNCWWGIVEGWSPQKYLWSGYRDLFNIIQEFKLKLQVVLAFNDYLPVGSSDFAVTLPKWVLEIGKDNQDIFFTDSEGRRNTECLSWGIDKERVLQGRTGIEVYFDFMKSFRMEFDDLFAEGLILGLEIGLGASGELKYPSFSERMGWSYPGIGEFQCYDKYLQQSLHKAAKLRGHTSWGKAPDNAGCYKSHPNETEFFSNCGVYDSYYGRFFLHWYSQTLINHADRVLTLTRLAFEDTDIIIKIPVVYWWYKTTSHAAELTAGFYNPQNRDGYCAIWKMLKKHSVTMKFVCPDPQIIENNEALADSERLCLQILNSAWDQGLTIAAQNGYRMLDLKRTLEIAKPMDDPDHRHLSFFAYQRPLNAMSQTTDMGLSTLDYFVKLMHGEVKNHHHHQV